MIKIQFPWPAVVQMLLIVPYSMSAGTISELLDLSDAVVIAVPFKVSPRSDSALIDLSVKDWISGKPSRAPVAIVASWAGGRVSFGNGLHSFELKPVAGIWFLKSQPDGTYRVNSVRGPKTQPEVSLYLETADPAACKGPLAPGTASTPYERLVLELACEAQFNKPGQRPNLLEFGDALKLGRGARTSTRLRAAFQYLAALPESKHKAVGISALLIYEDPLALTLLEHELPNLTDGDLRMMAVGAWRTPDPDAIHRLGKMAVGPRGAPDLQYGIAVAFAAMHTTVTLPYLARLLDSPDARVKKQALLGFVSFIHGRPISTPESIRSGEFMKQSKTPYSNDETWKAYAFRNPTEAQLNAECTYWKNWLLAHPELPQVESILTK